MFLKKSLKTILFPAANILVTIFLLSIFIFAIRNVVQTFPVASMTALNNLQPKQMDYFWQLNIHQAAVDKNKIRCFTDYYEHLLQVFPSLWDAYGLLGYCYHYLNDDPKAIKFLKIAIQNYPGYFWNYYNLAAIYINEYRYQEAYGLLGTALNLPLETSLKKLFASQWVYQPLLGSDEKEVLVATAQHLKDMYKSNLVLMQVLSQTGKSKEIREVMKKIKLDLYAF
jgi:tetratricopeptide (TPR) repeat protein